MINRWKGLCKLNPLDLLVIIPSGRENSRWRTVDWKLLFFFMLFFVVNCKLSAIGHVYVIVLLKNILILTYFNLVKCQTFSGEINGDVL